MVQEGKQDAADCSQDDSNNDARTITPIFQTFHMANGALVRFICLLAFKKARVGSEKVPFIDHTSRDRQRARPKISRPNKHLTRIKCRPISQKKKTAGSEPGGSQSMNMQMSKVRVAAVATGEQVQVMDVDEQFFYIKSAS